MKRRDLLRALPAIAGAPFLVGGQTPTPPSANTGVTEFSLITLANVQTAIHTGRATSSDYASARTALSVLSVHWEEIGVHDYLNIALPKAISEAPYFVLSSDQIQSIYQGMKKYGSTASLSDVQRTLILPESQRSAATKFLSTPGAILSLEKNLISRLQTAEKGGNVPAMFSRRAGVHLLPVDDNTSWYLGWAGIYVTVIGIACPPCAVTATAVGLGLAIVAQYY